ncbi:UL37 [Suid alphaherpesvirus 1]|uniref:UL37 n=1 Tax=Suid herpesvirus 1 TaxID=10345 RepID=A0A0D5C684_SUHV|nr:UL37 [Suid alphaherpesvirus 1]
MEALVRALEEADHAVATVVQSHILEFFMAPGRETPAGVRGLWARALRLACRAYAATGTCEAAVLAKNLAGLALWRLRHDWDEGTAPLLELLGVVNADATTAALTEAGLRTSAEFGPDAMFRLVSEWCAAFDEALAGARSADDVLAAPRVVPPEQTARALVQPRFATLYDMDFVQDGLRHVARRTNWALPLALAVRQMQNEGLKPLTRALFALTIADEFFHDRQNPTLREQFAEAARAVDDAALVPVDEVNATPRTAVEVRVSAALAHGDAYVRELRPGTVARRLRTDQGVLALLDPGAQAVHVAAAADLDHAQVDATGVWEAVQASASPLQVVEALVTAGFTRRHCDLLERAVLDRAPRLTDAQRAVGCTAVVGGVVHRLLDDYGPGLDYVRAYTDVAETLEPLYGDVTAALGLPEKGVEHVVRHCMAPRPPTEHVGAARAALMREVAVAERRAGLAHSAAREALGTWLGFRAQSRWGLRADGAGETPMEAPTSAALVDLAAAADLVNYPSMVHLEAMADPSFAPFFVVTAVADAYNCLLTASYDRRAELAQVLTWARDYGAGLIPNVSGYRTKLAALVAALAREDLTVAHARNVEALAHELHGVVRAAAEVLEAPVPAPPALATSAFLGDLMARALRRRLEDLATYTGDLLDSMATAAGAVAERVVALERLFTCRFVFRGRTASVFAPGEGGPCLGTWRLADVVDAVGAFHAEVNTHRSDMRADAGALRGVMAQTTEALRECEALGLQAPVFRTLCADHARLSKLQTSAALTAGRLQAATVLRPVERFLARWDLVSAALRRAVDERGVLALAATLRETWTEAREEQAPPAAAFTPGELREAADRVLGDYHEVATDGDAGPDAVPLSASVNVRDWAAVNLEVLRRGARAPDDAGAGVPLLAQTWVPVDRLLAEVDAVSK